MPLRPDQDRFIREVGSAFRRYRTVVGQCPTAFGKTFAAAELIRRAVAKGRRVIFVAHLDELLEDTQARLTEYGLWVGRIQAGEPSDPDAPVQVCSLATLYTRGLAPKADLIIIDECHHATSMSMRRVLDNYPKAWILGLTATPCRSDGTPLGNVFQFMVVGPSIQELVSLGVLVPCDVVAPTEKLGGIAMPAIEAVRIYGANRPTVVFCDNVSNARKLAEDIGPTAACVDGKTPKVIRRTIGADFKSGTIQTLTSVAVLTEGWNAPRAEVGILACKVGSVAGYIQRVGRILRAYPGKTRSLWVDLTGCVHEHGMPDEPRVFSLSGKGITRATSPALKQCPACGAIDYPRPYCRCGYIFPPPPATKVTPAAVRLLTRDEIREAFAKRREKFDALCIDAARRGLKNMKWVGVMYKREFGEWPKKSPADRIAELRQEGKL